MTALVVAVLVLVSPGFGRMTPRRVVGLDSGMQLPLLAMGANLGTNLTRWLELGQRAMDTSAIYGMLSEQSVGDALRAAPALGIPR